VPAYYKES
jgi:hypothetical protein